MTLTYFTARSTLVTYAFLWEKVKTVDFSETIEAYDLKVDRCKQLIEIIKVCGYWRSRSFLYHIFSRVCMFCALLGQDIRWAFTGPLVLWFTVKQTSILPSFLVLFFIRFKPCLDIFIWELCNFHSFGLCFNLILVWLQNFLTWKQNVNFLENIC